MYRYLNEYVYDMYITIINCYQYLTDLKIKTIFTKLNYIYFKDEHCINNQKVKYFC